ncbi:methyl-accepting chemotaxis protein [Pleurocapsa sp. PCC 7319]|uniref:methyl-accepting chemotaxis protein n=1 Tax=Pleurocapsa sp. PCC 7319 TaxID=118161 RepID=UPI000348B515|nr:methyl-accepting chemotaxis protein [Pleurocapsa sp. PCC 7319]
MITNLFIQDSSGVRNKITQAKNASKVLKSVAASELPLKERIFRSWTGLDLRRKATLIALAIGIVPIATVGGVAHHLATQSLMKQIVSDQESTTLEIRQKVSLFTNHLISDIDSIASSPLYTDSGINQVASVSQKIAHLDNYIDTHRHQYDSIAMFDTNGNLMFQSKSPRPLDSTENYSNREYFQRAIESQSVAVNTPEINSAASVNNSLDIAAPIKDEETGAVIGVLAARMPLTNWQHIFQPSLLRGLEHKLVDSNGQVFAADERELLGRDAGMDFKDLPELMAQVQEKLSNGGKATSIIGTRVMFDNNDRDDSIVSVASIPQIEGVMGSGWQLAVSTPVDEAFAPLNQLRLTLLLGTTGAALLIGGLAALLAHQATLPIVAAAGAVKKIGRGDWDTQLEVTGSDELATLGSNINKMAVQLKSLIVQKDKAARRSQLLKDLTLKLAGAVDSRAVFQLAVEEIIPILKVDRAIIYRHQRDEQGEIVAEAVKSDRVARLQTKVAQLNYLHQYLMEDDSEQVRVVNNIYQAKFKLPHLRELEAFEVKSELSAPLFVGQQFQGFLVIQQCDRSRTWRQGEIDFFAQLASQVMLAKERTDLLLEQKSLKEQLQQQAMELLMEVDPISKGDLTIRATIREGEIGTIADSYNATVENLRQIVTQVQQSVTQIASTTSNNGEIAQSLSSSATEQSEAIASALKQIKTMTESIQNVAAHAELVEKSFQEVTNTVTVGNLGMERTVEGIFAIRETVADTAKKVKRLGESSLKISKVVNLINSFADRTNLLALNASLEANRAGQDGQNFAIVAEEVQTLAKQSAEATTEIEKLVASIQLDTKEVSTAMEQGTEQVVAGTKLVNETRQKLNQIASSSTVVGDRLKQIAQETVQQSRASQQINNTIAEVAQIASQTSSDAIAVSDSTKQLLKITDQLQTSAQKFKV